MGGETYTPRWRISLARSNLTYKGSGTSKGHTRTVSLSEPVTAHLDDELRSNRRSWHNLSTDD